MMLFLLVVTIYGILRGASGLLCFSCSNIISSENCANIVECTGREKCFTTADAFSNGSVHYNVGCTSDMVPPFAQGQPFCSQVCGESLCNLDQCQLPVSTKCIITRPLRCLSCDLVIDPAQCKNLLQCRHDEMCFSRKITTFGNTRYRLECMNKQHCVESSTDNNVPSAIVGKRSDHTSDSCAMCCSKDHCNVKACGKQHETTTDDKSYNLQLLGDRKTCFDFNPVACAAFGNLDTDACKVMTDVDNLCPESCGMCGHYGWTQWEEWSACTQSCNTGMSERIRQCIYQLDVVRNKTCIGPTNGTQACNVDPCAVHGQWSEWGDWSNCSVTCENGTKIRHRDCDNPLPQFGGLNCTGDSIQIEECADLPCPVDGGWCWSSQRTCTSPRSGCYTYSTMYTQSSCNCPAPKNGGKQCS